MTVIKVEPAAERADERLDGPALVTALPMSARSIELRTVRKLISDRRRREHHFDAALFADPAWDMLLDLYASELADKVVCVSALCVAAAVPTATALRWIGTLDKAGLVERFNDPTDRRRVQVRLTKSGRARMASYVCEIQLAPPL